MGWILLSSGVFDVAGVLEFVKEQLGVVDMADDEAEVDVIIPLSCNAPVSVEFIVRKRGGVLVCRSASGRVFCDDERSFADSAMSGERSKLVSRP